MYMQSSVSAISPSDHSPPCIHVLRYSSTEATGTVCNKMNFIVELVYFGSTVLVVLYCFLYTSGVRLAPASDFILSVMFS